MYALMLWVLGIAVISLVSPFLLDNKWPFRTCIGFAAVIVVAAFADQVALACVANIAMWIVAFSSIHKHFQRKRMAKKMKNLPPRQRA